MSVRPDPAQGIFETVRVAEGRVQLLEAHLHRLRTSWAAVYGSEPPTVSEANLLTAARAAPGADPTEARAEARVRIDLTPHPDAGAPAVTLTARPVTPGPAAPVALAPVVAPGGLGPHKWRDRSWLDALGADPVPLLIDTDGAVLEAAWGNVWVLDGDRLRTPSADGRILPGVTRAELLRRAGLIGLRAEEAPLTLDDVRGAPVVFVTSAVRLAVGAAVIAAVGAAAGGPTAGAAVDTVPTGHARVAEIRAALAVA